MSTLEQAARMALEALEGYRREVSLLVDSVADAPPCDAEVALRAALAAGHAQPVAWLCELAQEDGTVKTQIVQEDPNGLRWNDSGEPSPFRVTPLYAAPPAQPLTDEQIEDLIPFTNRGHKGNPSWGLVDMVWFARAIERAHGIT